mmetsp:Transcript_12184/g.51302  ORF Transcript_12184/g.51302 Transcript_12184/m.51302 type:complete len:204 (+) Transcript_12184:1226-1837(+)
MEAIRARSGIAASARRRGKYSLGSLASSLATKSAKSRSYVPNAQSYAFSRVMLHRPRSERIAAEDTAWRCCSSWAACRARPTAWSDCTFSSSATRSRLMRARASSRRGGCERTSVVNAADSTVDCDRARLLLLISSLSPAVPHRPSSASRSAVHTAVTALSPPPLPSRSSSPPSPLPVPSLPPSLSWPSRTSSESSPGPSTSS